MDAALLALMPDTVTVEAYSTQNVYNEATYGAASTYQCRVQGQTKMIRTPAGEEKVSTVQVYLASAAGITVRDRITLPARFAPTTPEIMAVAHYGDESGPYSEVVYC